MRVVLLLLAVVAVLGVLGFGLTNPDQRVDVNLLHARYADVRLVNVVLAAFALGAGFVSIIAVIEGAGIRLANRRLRREMSKLDSEIHFLRTQPTGPRREPDAVERTDPPPAPHAPGRAGGLPSAPVYGPGGDAADPTDPDDDAYSGGRAV